MFNAEQFNILSKKRSSGLCKKYNLQFLPTDDSDPVLCVILENNHIQLRFLYGPPEFHIELALTDKSSNENDKYSLLDLAKVPRIMNWLKEYVADNQSTKPEAEVNWLCSLLEEFGDELLCETKPLLQELDNHLNTEPLA